MMAKLFDFGPLDFKPVAQTNLSGIYAARGNGKIFCAEFKQPWMIPPASMRRECAEAVLRMEYPIENCRMDHSPYHVGVSCSPADYDGPEDKRTGYGNSEEEAYEDFIEKLIEIELEKQHGR